MYSCYAAVVILPSLTASKIFNHTTLLLLDFSPYVRGNALLAHHRQTAGHGSTAQVVLYFGTIVDDEHESNHPAIGPACGGVPEAHSPVVIPAYLRTEDSSFVRGTRPIVR